MLYFHMSLYGKTEPVPAWEVYLILGIALAVILAFYALRSIGLYVLAKRQNVEHAFIAWIPCVWIFTACKIIGNVKLFNRPFTKLALIFCIIFSAAEVITLAYNFLIYFPIVGNFLAGRPIILADGAEGLREGYEAWTSNIYVYTGVGADKFINPYGVTGIIVVEKILNVLSFLSLFLDLASIFITITVYVNLFRKFWPQHYILATILSAMGIFAPFIFMIRKREPIDYMTYIRSRYNYGPYGMYGTPYGNPYGGNPYGGGATQKQPEHPFEEYAEKGEVDPGDPFEEFNEDKKDKD